uniref:hypothetical protein n=1 Tax=Segatella hominis TaxID=2518605 RepID=UPI004038AEB7
MIKNKTTSDCTIYAFVGTAILAISLVVAMYVGNDFHQSLFVESIIFVGSNILLWAIFISMVNCPYELMTIGSNGKTKKNVVEAESVTEQPKQTLPQTESAQYSHEDYAKCVEAQEKDAQEEKDKRTRTVLDYVHRTMSRFLYEEDLYKVIEAITEWSNDTNYTPTAISRFKETVKNIPLRHFVWNISERLGKRDYTMAMRIAFIKALFPKPFEGLDYSTLKNLKAPCSNDVIPIDEPDNGGYDFHDVTEKIPE